VEAQLSEPSSHPRCPTYIFLFVSRHRLSGISFYESGRSHAHFYSHGLFAMNIAKSAKSTSLGSTDRRTAWCWCWCGLVASWFIPIIFTFKQNERMSAEAVEPLRKGEIRKIHPSRYWLTDVRVNIVGVAQFLWFVRCIQARRDMDVIISSTAESDRMEELLVEFTWPYILLHFWTYIPLLWREIINFFKSRSMGYSRSRNSPQSGDQSFQLFRDDMGAFKIDLTFIVFPNIIFLLMYSPLEIGTRLPSEPFSDYTRWRLLVSDGGRHTWHYLESDEEIQAWPQTTIDKYWLGMATVWYCTSFRLGHFLMRPKESPPPVPC